MQKIPKAYESVKTFEKEIAHWAGARYGVAVSSCSNAILLCLEYLGGWERITIPHKTYPSVAMSILHTKNTVSFSKKKWKGIYKLEPTNIIDSALRFQKGMYIKGSLYCLSFHYKKHLPIGRGGMILTDDKNAAQALRELRFDGRTEGVPLKDDEPMYLGYNMYMEPSQAARGLILFELLKNKNRPDLKVKDQNYPDLSKWRCLQ